MLHLASHPFLTSQIWGANRSFDSTAAEDWEEELLPEAPL
jgi:hypothetical protein